MSSIIGSVIKEGAEAVSDIINKPAEIKAGVAIAEINADKEVAVAQNQVNQAQAQSDDKYTSRARPTIMYICGAGFVYQFILQPFLIFLMQCYGKVITIPVLDMTAIVTVLLSLCGLRSLDKGSFDNMVRKK